jgi:PAS domain S-box-containing protein
VSRCYPPDEGFLATILIIDDLSPNRQLLMALLAAEGYRFLEASDGSEGLALVRAEHPDLVITDVLMPVMDGYEFVKQLRADPATAHVPVVFYTAHYVEPEARVLALAAGASFVLQKPVVSAAVLQTIRDAVAGRSESAASATPVLVKAGFDHDHLRLVTDKLSETTGDLQTTNDRLRSLIEIGLDLASERDREKRVQRLGASACDLFAATYVTAGLMHAHALTVQCVFTCGTDAADWIDVGGELSGVLRTAVTEQRTIRGDNTDGDPTTLDLPALHPAIHAFLVVPIRSTAQVYGWICLVGNHGRTFTREDEQLVGAMAGQVGRLCELEDEIGERKHAEGALRTSEGLTRTLLEHVPHRIVVKDRQSNILFCNEGYARQFNLQPAQVIGKNVSAFYPSREADAYNAEDADVMTRAKPISHEHEHQVDGQEQWVHVVKVPYRDSEGTVIGVLCMFEDITERRLVERRHQQAQKMEAIGRLAGGVAHDFNNLLTAIIGYSEMVLSQIGPDKPISRDLAEIRHASDRAVALTTQLLEFGRAQPLEVIPVSLNDVITETRNMLGRIIGEDIEIKLGLAEGLPCVLGNRVQLEQVLVNLVMNARDAMPRGGTITIDTTTADPRNDADIDAVVAADAQFVRLRITDTGSGMDAATRERIFDPFFTTKEIGEGTGLGLATVHGVVQQFKGHISVASELACGTTFSLYFPQAPAGSVTPMIEQPSMAAVPLAVRGETVLVVEDQSTVRQLLLQVLRRHGYTVHEAADPNEALRCFEQSGLELNLLITDVMMPVMTGPALVARLRERQPALKCVYISGYSGDYLIARANLESTATVLEKPFTPSALLQTVREALDGDSPAQSARAS